MSLIMNLSSPVREASLGLQTPASFEVKLLEAAVKGKMAFENLWEKNKQRYDINKQVMWHEILQDVELWESKGDLSLLLLRARKLVVRLKSNEEMRARALVIYLDFLKFTLPPRTSRSSFQVPLSPLLREASLDLKTHASFDVKLLEVAVKGSKAFRDLWDKEGAEYDINKQVMWYETLQEVECWECNGNLSFLEQRVRKLVVRLKVTEELHTRALVIYRDLLDLSHSPRTTYIPQGEIDEKFHHMEIVELPQVDEENMSPSSDRLVIGTGLIGTLLGEPTNEPALSIFQKPEEEEGGTTGASDTGPTGEIGCEIQYRYKLSSVNSNSFTEAPGATLPGTISMDSECTEGMSIDDEKVRYSSGAEGSANDRKTRSSSAMAARKSFNLGNFPWGDFKEAVEWRVDKQTYKAENIDDLRKNHKVLVEGTFQKRCRGHKWRHYYGFFMDTGVLLYFRKEYFKKVADFRNSTVSMPRGKHFRLNVERITLDSKENNWLMEFDLNVHLAIWYRAMVLVSKGVKIDIETLV